MRTAIESLHRNIGLHLIKLDKKQIETNIATPAPSATVLLLKDDGESLKVFMVVRNSGFEFAGGALVFPGGRVDLSDSITDSNVFAPGFNQFSREEVSNRVCAIRETFEEAGILLARDRLTSKMLNNERCLELVSNYREAIHSGDITFKDMLIKEGLELVLESLVPYAHWITPERSSKRFDTWFYAVRTPEGQLGAHDEIESVESMWITPKEAIDGGNSGYFKLVFATKMNLRRIENLNSVSETLKFAMRSKIVAIEPKVEREGNRIIFSIPKDAGYGIVREVEEFEKTVIKS